MVNTQLYLDPYCDGCPHFDAESEILETWFGGDAIIYQVTITCTNASKCKVICEYLKKATKSPRPIVRTPKTNKIEYDYPFNEEGGFDE